MVGDAAHQAHLKPLSRADGAANPPYRSNMIQLTKRLDHSHPADATLTLPYDSRTRSRLRVTLDDGREAGLLLERGATLRGGDLLASDDGLVVQIQAAPETCSTAHCTDPLLLARVCYHLGNRHVPLQIEAGRARYQHDHVLDDMVRGLGPEVVVEQVPFEPEAGAYSGGGHGHGSHHHHD